MEEKIRVGSGAADCTQPELAELLLFYLNEDVERDERSRIEAHVAHCIACQVELRLLRTLQKIQKEKAASVSPQQKSR